MTVPKTSPSKSRASDEFAQSYLASRGLKDSGDNRSIVARAVRGYPGATPGAEQLAAYLDRLLLR